MSVFDTDWVDLGAVFNIERSCGRLGEKPAALPLTPNGKIDRKALPQLKETLPGSPQSLQVNRIEETLIEIWKELLGVAEVGLDDNFFDLGGHSLLIIRMSNLIKERLPGHVKVVQENIRREAESEAKPRARASARRTEIAYLFRYPTIRSLAGYLSENQEESELTKTSEFQTRMDRRDQFLSQMRTMRMAGGG